MTDTFSMDIILPAEPIQLDIDYRRRGGRTIPDKICVK